jgi:hypothetical protein
MLYSDGKRARLVRADADGSNSPAHRQSPERNHAMSKKHLIVQSLASIALVASLGACAVPAAQPAASSTAATTTAAATDATQEDIQYVLYLGTNDKDTNQPVFSHEESKEKAKEILIKELGGYTIQEAEGGWVDDSGTVYQEYTLVIHLSDATLDQVHKVCDELIETFHQSSVLIHQNKTTTEFYAAIQEDVIDVNDVVEQYEAIAAKPNESTARGTAEEFVLQAPTTIEERHNDDILTIGEDVKGINYKLARCCNPIFGDRIEGFIASDGAIKVHRSDCKNLRHLKERYPYRIIRTRWTGKAGSQFVATLKVLGRDDIGIVSSITSVINKTDNCLLRSISVQAEGGLFEGLLSVNVNNIGLLDDLTKKILNVKGVKQVDRM